MNKKLLASVLVVGGSWMILYYLGKSDPLTADRSEIRAILIAGQRMRDKITNGEYDHKDSNAVDEDFEFEIIAAHYE